MDSILLASYMCFADSITHVQNHINSLALQPSYDYPYEIKLKPAQNYHQYAPGVALQENLPEDYVYYSKNPHPKAVISREIYDRNGAPLVVLKMNEVGHHNFSMDCYVDEEVDAEYVVGLLLEVLDEIYDDTEYVIANIKEYSETLVDILVKMGFDEVVRNEQYVLN